MRNGGGRGGGTSICRLGSCVVILALLVAWQNLLGHAQYIQVAE